MYTYNNIKLFLKGLRALKYLAPVIRDMSPLSS